MRDLLNELGLGADPVAIDDDGLLWLAPACDDWAPIVQQHALSAVIDLEAGLDAGIPAHPDQVIYVYFPFKDEDVPTLHKLHAVARRPKLVHRAGHGCQVGRAGIRAGGEAEIDQQKLAAEVGVGAQLALVVDEREGAADRLFSPHDDVHQLGGGTLLLPSHRPQQPAGDTREDAADKSRE